MDPKDFRDPTTGHLVSTLAGQKAFVPAPLPPAIDWTAIALPMSRAMGAIGELRGACRRLPNPYMLVRPLQHREAMTSSAMEGTYTTDDYLLLAESGMAPPRDESTREVVNYISALSEALGMLKALPISHRVLKRSHEILLSGLSPARGSMKKPGQYKAMQNAIGGRTIETARFIPPPPAEAEVCMDELERYINREDTTVPGAIVDLALVHYQVETIHPFDDGNGRVGRMLISLMAVQSGLLEMPVLYMSPAFERDKNRYIDLMYNVSSSGAWTAWLVYFFDCIEFVSRETVATIDRLLALQADYRRKVRDASRSANAISLVDHLFEQPAITVVDAAERLSVTYPAAKKTIEKLVELGILVEFPDIYPKAFYAPSILRVARPDSASPEQSSQV